MTTILTLIFIEMIITSNISSKIIFKYFINNVVISAILLHFIKLLTCKEKQRKRERERERKREREMKFTFKMKINNV